MTYNVVCKKIDLSDERKEMMLKKIRKLDKFFDDATDCRIVVSEQKENIIVEITIQYKGFFFRAEDRDRDLLDAVDECMANLDRQIRKNKTKLSKKMKEASFDEFDLALGNDAELEEEEFTIIKTKKFSAKPMMVEEAILQMNMLGHDFFIFSNPETMDTSVVYKRKDGNYGLIEAD